LKKEFEASLTSIDKYGEHLLETLQTKERVCILVSISINIST